MSLNVFRMSSMAKNMSDFRMTKTSHQYYESHLGFP